MNQYNAAVDTIVLARSRGMNNKVTSVPELSYEHLADMLYRMQTMDMSGAKMGRWLGWMQCAVVAAGCGTLEEMKQINMKYAG